MADSTDQLPLLLSDEIASLRELREREAVIRLSVDLSGRPLAVCTGADAIGVAFGEADVDEEGVPRSGLAPAPYPITIFRFEDGAWVALAQLSVDVVAPHVQPLAGGEILVVGTYSRFNDGRPDPNAVFYRDGRVQRRFAIGDGVEDVQASPAGSFWVSYFDLGTMGDFGRHGWGRLSPDRWIDPIGMPGLRHFTPEGRPLQAFGPNVGARAIVDCYALNVWASEAWASYHPDFPLVRMSSAGVRAWESDLGAVDAIGISGSAVLACASYAVDPTVALVGRMEGGRVNVEPVRLDLGDAPPRGRIWFRGRGPTVHAVAGDSWLVISVPGTPADAAQKPVAATGKVG